MFVCVYVHACRCIQMCECMRASASLRVHECLCLHECTRVSLLLHVCVCACLCTLHSFFVRHAMSNFHHFSLKSRCVFFLELHPYLPDVFAPGPKDMHGAAVALIRLQRTYSLDPADVIRGKILGHQGFPLTMRDALLVAKAARLTDNLPEASQWLTLLLGLDDVTDDVKAAALGHLGLISLTVSGALQVL